MANEQSGQPFLGRHGGGKLAIFQSCTDKLVFVCTYMFCTILVTLLKEVRSH